MKKKIHKEEDSNKWRHDKYKVETVKEKARPPKELNAPSIVFEGSPGYNKIFPLVKHLKIYIR